MFRTNGNKIIIWYHRCSRRNNGNEIRKRNNLHKKGNISKDTDDTDTVKIM